MTHFYLTLPSNSSLKYYPDNTVARFTTRLQNPVSLSGEWEVGLAEIQYQHSWYNISRGEGRFTYTKHINPQYGAGVLRVPAGYYESVDHVVNQINQQIADFAGKLAITNYPSFKYNEISKRILATLHKGDDVSFGTHLAALLGIGNRQNPLSHGEESPIQWKANNVCDLNRGFYSMYVYCDVLEHVPVGDARVPLLRIVDVSGKSGETVHRIYDKMQYVPLQKKMFDSIEIDIRNDSGTPVPFEFGKVVLTLHFRMSKSPYFLR